MDIALLLIGFTCMILGIVGSFLPVLPGPGLSWLGILLLYLTNAVPMNYWILGITLIIAIVITVLDYAIPAQGTKHFGGSPYGIWGTNIGLIVGIFAPVPFGFLIGPFVGALVGELIYNSADHKRALKAATGSLIGFVVSGFMQFVIGMIFLGLFLVVAWQHRGSF
jgi:uncharacterized protein YqgC (DUF456 family)